MTKTFNLLDSPWLPVRMASGQVKEVGLLELFAESGKITALAETAPPSLVAQYRLLLAITHRALSMAQGSWKDSDRRRWMKEGLPLAAIEAYLQQWRERFWLFHPEQPFMQVAALAKAVETADKLKPWTQIDLASSSGNAPVVFDHAVDTRPASVPAALALRTLLGFLQFTPGGLVKVFRDADKAGPLANTAAVVPLGANLAQTLILGLSLAVREQADLPSWERPVLLPADLMAEPLLATGPNDRYTRQSRAVLLQPEADGSVRWLRFAAGQALADDANAPDPMASYKAGSNKLVRLTFNEGRAFWRDLTALLPDASGGRSHPAAILQSALGLNSLLGDPWQPLLVAGLASDQAKLLRWRCEQLRLPANLLQNEEAADWLRHLLDDAEALFTELRHSGTNLIAETLPESQHKDTRSRARSLFDTGPAPALYFAHAERSLAAVLTAIAAEQEEQALVIWHQALRQAADHSWQALLVAMGNSAKVLRAGALTQPRFAAAMRKLLTALPSSNLSAQGTYHD